MTASDHTEWLELELQWWLTQLMRRNLEDGLSHEEIVERLGQPERLVDRWLGEHGYAQYLR
jgi:hypothetical protein